MRRPAHRRERRCGWNLLWRVDFGFLIQGERGGGMASPAGASPSGCFKLRYSCIPSATFCFEFEPLSGSLNKSSGCRFEIFHHYTQIFQTTHLPFRKNEMTFPVRTRCLSALRCSLKERVSLHPCGCCDWDQPCVCVCVVRKHFSFSLNGPWQRSRFAQSERWRLQFSGLLRMRSTWQPVCAGEIRWPWWRWEPSSNKAFVRGMAPFANIVHWW